MVPHIMMTAVGITGAVFFAGYVLLLVLDPYQVQLEARLRALARSTPHGRNFSAASMSTIGHGGATEWWSALGRLVPHSAQDLRPYRSRLLQAGYSSSNALSVFFLVRLVGMVVPIAIGAIVYHYGLVDRIMDLLICGSLSAVGFLAPSVWLDRRIAGQRRALQRALPDFLDLMIVCLGSGLSLPGTIRRVGDEIRLAHPRLADELQTVQREMTLGATLDVAFNKCAEQTGSDDMQMLATAIRESRRFGTVLVEALRSQADMLRFEREQRAEEQAQQASVKILLPLLLLILPAVFIVLAGPAAIQIQQAFAR